MSSEKRYPKWRKCKLCVRKLSGRSLNFIGDATKDLVWLEYSEMADELDFDQLLRKTASKLKKLKIAEDQGLQQAVFLMKLYRETRQILGKEDIDPSKPRPPSNRELDLLEMKLHKSFVIRDYLDDIVDQRYSPKRVHKVIARYCDRRRPVQQMRHRTFVPTKPMRALVPVYSKEDYEEFEEEYSFEIVINFRNNCLKRRLTVLDIEEICIARDRLKIYGRRNLRQPYKFLP